MAFRHATCSSSSSGSSGSSSQARGKGVAPEAGPWHGAAGLRVKPERAALRRRLVAIAVAAMMVAGGANVVHARGSAVTASQGEISVQIVAQVSLHAHLIKLAEDGKARETDSGWQRSE